MAAASDSHSDSYNYTITRYRRTAPYNYSTRKYEPITETVFAIYTGSALPYSRARSWTRTDNYRLLKAAGTRIPDNPFSYSLLQAKNSPGEVWGPATRTTSSGYGQTRYVYPSFVVGGNAAFPDLVDANRVYAKLIDRAKGSGFNAPVFLAESRQTASMVHQRAISMVNGLRALRKGNLDKFMSHMHPSFTPSKAKRRAWSSALRSDVKGSTKGASSVWLEARYGWLPFISEVHSAFESLNEIAERQESLYARVSARVKAESTVVNNGITLLNLGADGGLRCDSVEKLSEEVKAVWVFLPTETDAFGRLGLTNPLEVAWELVPFSFVADWFVPVGNYLSYLDVQSRFRHVGGTVGRRKERSVVYTSPRSSLTSSEARVIGFSGLGYTAVSVNRYRLNSAPIPSLESIAFNPNINSKRVVDSIALLRQLLFK